MTHRTIAAAVLLVGLCSLTNVAANDRVDSAIMEVTTICTFNSPVTSGRWMIVNDGVMGGTSSSRIDLNDSGVAVFSGTVSLENNGGFASTRSVLDQTDLSGHSGIVIRIRGDGNRYQFRVRTSDGFDGVAYRHNFDTEPDIWREIKLPFSDFLPTFRGRILSDVPPLDPSRIAQIGFLIAEKQEGEFRLEIDSIGVYR